MYGRCGGGGVYIILLDIVAGRVMTLHGGDGGDDGSELLCGDGICCDGDLVGVDGDRNMDVRVWR